MWQNGISTADFLTVKMRKVLRWIFFDNNDDHIEICLQGYKISLTRCVVTVNDGPELPQVYVEVSEGTAPVGSLPEFGLRLLNNEFDILRRGIEWAALIFKEQAVPSSAEAKKRIFVPTQGTGDWKNLLADPEKHWRSNYSAMTIANSWEKSSGFPPEIVALFSNSGIASFDGLELLCAFPEYKVDLPPYGRRASQNDLFVIAKAADGGLVSIMIEGKVNEPFGPRLKEWKEGMSPGKAERLRFLQGRLGFSTDVPNHIRYQLIHRAASALIEAERFNAGRAVMLIHSFSENDQWFDDYQAFLSLFGIKANQDKLHFLKKVRDIDLYSGWVRGKPPIAH
ncbi:MAG: DUF6946 family protein [Acidobacteriota bacterium]